jgi:hypothetical protein
MMKRVSKLMFAGGSELIVLLGIFSSNPVALYKLNETSHILDRCFSLDFFSGQCYNAFKANPTGLDTLVVVVAIVFVISIFFQSKKLLDSWRKAMVEPLGFFFDRVSEPGSGTTIERSLVQVVRKKNGELEYRGVGAQLGADPSLSYWWRARDAWIYRSTTSDRHKLVFRTAPDSMRFAPAHRSDGTPLKPGEVLNVGVIEYEIADGKTADMIGMFFDYTLNDNYLRRGRKNCP